MSDKSVLRFLYVVFAFTALLMIGTVLFDYLVLRRFGFVGLGWIIAMTGLQRQGKTLDLVRTAWFDKLEGYYIATNFDCDFADDDNISLKGLDANFNERGISFAVMEAKLFFSKHAAFHKDNRALNDFMQTVVKRDCHFRYDSLWYRDVDVNVRQNVHLVIKHVRPGHYKDPNVPIFRFGYIPIGDDNLFKVWADVLEPKDYGVFFRHFQSFSSKVVKQ